MKKLTLALLLLVNLTIQSQPLSTIQHYSSNEGLSQNTVMSIIQDHKGYMWFATWDGLNKFDGYSFTTYKTRPGDLVSLSNSRIDQIAEDHTGKIWLMTYDRKIHRFDPETGLFSHITDENKPIKHFPNSFTRIDILKNNAVWLLSESEGAVKAVVKDNQLLDVKVFSTDNGLIEGNNIYKVISDKKNNEWILTDNGLAQLKSNDDKTNVFFFESREARQAQGQAFFSSFETESGIWFGSIKGRIWKYEFQGDKFELLELGCPSNVTDIKQLRDKRMLMTTSGDGFFVFDPASGKTTQYNSQNSNLPINEILSAFVDSYGDVWLQQELQGITCFRPATGKIKFHPTQTEHNNIQIFQASFFIVEDNQNHLWVHPKGGGFSHYNRETDQLEYFHNNPRDPQRRFSNMLHSVYNDKQGNLWICTRSKGLEKITYLDKQFDLLRPAPNKTEPFANGIRAVMQDDLLNYWISTKDGMLYLYNQRMQPVGYLNQSGVVANSGTPIDGVCYTIMQDSKGTIWIGTKGKGLFKASRTSPQSYSFKIEQFTSNTDDIYSLSNDNVYYLHEDDKGRIWVATFGGGINYIDASANGKTIFINHRNNLKGYPINSCFKARQITSGPNDNILVASTNGLVMFNNDFVDPENISFKHYAFTPGDKNCLSNNDVHCILVTQNRDVYIATFGGGLNKMTMPNGDQPVFNALTTNDGLTSDVILSIIEDNQQQLWMTTEDGLSKFDPKLAHFENYDERNFGAKVLFSEASSMADRANNVWFGSDMGVIVFNPANIHKSKFVPNIVLTGLSLFNKQISPAPKGSVLTKHIDNTEELVLTHKQNVFSIAYAALDMKYTDKVTYAIKLDGFDDDWKYMHKQRNATYTNLPHGKYVLRIKSTNSDGVWVDNERSIKINVLPSFWVTGWAYIIYFLAFVIIIAVSGYILFIIYRLKNNVVVEHQLTELKLKFFTDISHELRTPLTLIAAPIEHMLQQNDLPQHTKDELKLVERNTDRMLRLINQILDFVKIQNRKMDLRVEEIEIGQAVAKIMENFKSLASDHKIDFSLDDQTNGEVLYLDMDKFEKIVFNLLSNAFKFTNSGKSIKVILENKKDSVVLRVKDSGVGISENKRKALFERFESFLDRNLFAQPSTGIGLSLVKQLVDLHKARIEVDSKIGEGTIFSIEFMKGIAHFDNDTEIIVPENMEAQPKIPCADEETMGDEESTDTTILVVEDNDEMRQFLKNILGKNYRVLDAANGSEGLDIAMSQIPDLVISDIMMQGTDGLELTRKLRNELHTSHIPIILLTAKTTIESKLEGLETGADDYITKPFSTTYLLARIENLLEQRQKLQSLYRSQLGVKQVEVNPSQPQIHSYDQKFLEDLTALMEKNMDNGNLVVDDLVSEMGVSRSVFFKKLKTLTGLAPIEFIKEMRVKRAAQLMAAGQYNMTQISYMVGINDPRYFSKCFKQFFGVTPTEYKDQLSGK